MSNTKMKIAHFVIIIIYNALKFSLNSKLGNINILNESVIGTLF